MYVWRPVHDEYTVPLFILICVDLIKHLYSDGHITTEEASQLSAKKLFEAPPATPTVTASPISLSSATPSASSNSASTATPATSYDSFSSTFGLLQGINLKLCTTGATASGTTSISNVQQSAGPVTLPQRLPTQLDTTVIPNTPLALSIATFPSSVSVKNVLAIFAATASQAAIMAAKTGGQRAGLVMTSEAGQSGSLAVSDDVSQAMSLAVSDASSNEDHSYYDDLVYDENDDTASGMTYHTVCEFSLDEISIKIHIYKISINALLIPVTSLHNNLF